jgi:TIR domain/Deacetylase PdaC/Protein of unknown function (DUF3298)
VIVFLSYAKEDVSRVEQIYADLQAAGYQPWMDTHDLKPGQDWKAALQLAISKCDAALICLSNNSVSKTGYVQVELREFFEQRKRRPEGARFVFPVRLEPCTVPASMADLHYADLFEPGGWDRVVASLSEVRQEKLVLAEQGETRGNFSIFTKVIEEEWEGLPGYSVRLSYPEIHDLNTGSLVCHELNDIFRARALQLLHTRRSNRFNQEPDFWQDKQGMAMYNTIADYKITFLSDAVLSVVTTIYEYTGGAHGMHFYRTDSYALQPIGRLPLSAFFVTGRNHWDKLGALARKGIKKQAWEYSLSDPSHPDWFADDFVRDWLAKGTTFNEGSDIEFTFSETGLTLYFVPYSVAPYAAGSFEVMLSYDDLRDVLRVDGPYRLFLPSRRNPAE